MVNKVDLGLALVLHLLQLLIRPSHLNQVLLRLEVIDVLHNILSQGFGLVYYDLVLLLTFNLLEVYGYFAQDVIEKKLCEVVGVVVHHPPTHFGEHANLPSILRQPPAVSCFCDLYVPLSLLNFLQHWLELVGEHRDLGLKILKMRVGVIPQS